MTAANSSSISDGAAALVLMRRSTAEKLGLKPLALDRRPRHARAGAGLVHHRAGRRDAEAAARRPAGAPTSVDLYEINEAFAVVTMAAMHELKLPHDKVNVHGGACALGHPIGASGARILVTLIGALRKTRRQARRRQPVHRRRRSHRHGDRTGLTGTSATRSALP